MKGSWFMYLILAIIIVAMLRNAAGSVGIILAGNEFAKGTIGALSGGSATTSKGSFTIGGNKATIG